MELFGSNRRIYADSFPFVGAAARGQENNITHPVQSGQYSYSSWMETKSMSQK